MKLCKIQCGVLMAGFVISACQTASGPKFSGELPGDLAAQVVTVEPEQVADGGLVRVQVVLPEAVREVVGAFGDQKKPTEFKFFKSGERFEAFFAIPFGQRPGVFEIPIRTSDGHAFKASVRVVSGEYASETLSVDPRHVKPPPAALARMQRESAEIGRVYRSSVEQRLWNGEFALPLQSGVTSSFGTKRVYNGEMQSFHTGTDFKAAQGTEIRAAAAGRVALCKDLYMTGKTVILDHGYGLFTVYAHLSEFKVRRGDSVNRAGMLGLSGATGRASGPHLHWAAVIHRTKFNPLDLLRLAR